MKRLLTIAAVSAAIAVAPSAAGAQSADPSISLVHGIPGVTVDLVVDGTVVLDAFAPGSIVDITSFAGRTLNDVEVVTDDTGDVVIGPVASLEVPATGNWSLIAHYDAGGDATLSQFENNVAQLSNNAARLTVRHTAEAPPVDLVIGDQRPAENLANGDSADVELPAGELTDASIALAGGAPVLDITGVTLAANTTTIIFVVGSAEDATLDDVVQVVQLAAAATTTTVDANATTTTTDPNATTTTTDPNATTTTVSSTTTTTAPTPSAVNTGSPLSDGSTQTLLVVALAGLALAGGSYLVRRRV